MQKLLNEGDYYNRTGTYANTGLLEKAREKIEVVKWYLGETDRHYGMAYGLVQHFYQYERGTTVSGGTLPYWIGKVGLIYTSDYGYVTSRRENYCFTTGALEDWDSNCYQDDWLYRGVFYYTISSTLSQKVFLIPGSGQISEYYASSPQNVFPSVYLRDDISILSGDGSSSNPYILGE